MAASEVSLDRMLEGMGISDPGALQSARQALMDGKVISPKPNRKNIAARKKDRVRELLDGQFRWHCSNGDCVSAAHSHVDSDMSRLLLVERQACQECGGSSNATALKDLDKAMAEAGLSCVLVVGGVGANRREIGRNISHRCEWRFVDGVEVPRPSVYKAHRKWAEVIVIWCSTPLDHKVSGHFDRKGDERVVRVSRRGIAAMAEEVIQHIQRVQRAKKAA